MPGTTQQEQEPKTSQKVVQLKDANGECILFFVYRSEWDRRVRNAIVRFLGRIKSYEGKVLGISTQLKVRCPEGNPWGLRNDWCAAAIIFSSQKSADLWFISEPEVKQHDFPPPSDGFMVFTVPVRYIPQPGRMTFCWTETKDIRNKGHFQSDFVDKVANLYDSKGINHGVVYIKEKEQNQLHRLKDCWIQQGANYRLDLYSSETEFEEIYNSDPYQPLKETRDDLSETTSVIFTLDPKIS